ncbi:family 16 glycoside hydrolase [Dyadobacter sp. NIV53]|uniref:family 16 glycoside hydrolase n=1 Tax=Dyadobacter sp. NIV53 TaxID=2861765 RepID=UPI001C883F46|nr:family 16 glycoside hydrolase [Dyadobacter sp. NIV53]
MKKHVYILLILCLLVFQAIAQTDQNRTLTTKVADLLAQVPAENAAGLKKNMEELAGLGKSGLVQIASMLTPPGKGDNTKIQYALGGFTYAATQSGKEEWRKMAAEAYGEALSKVNDPDSKNFLIYQLQTVGKDESVDILKSYLSDERLAGPASRTLARIASSASGAALLQALGTAKGTSQIAIIEALGESRYKEAASAIEKTAVSTDLNLRKVSLFALAEMGAPSSESILMAAAQKVLYRYDEADATAVYIKYLANLARNGSTAIAEKAALELIKNTPAPEQTATRSSALKVYSDSKKRESVPVLVKAMESTDPQYRASALKLGQKYTMADGTTPWLNAMKKAKPEVQAEIIMMLGRAESKDALPAVIKSLGSKDENVKLAAIWAAGKIGQESSIVSLIPILKNGNAEEIKTVKSTLLTMKGNNVVDMLATALPSLPVTSQPAVIDVLAARGASSKFSVITALLKSTDPEVKKSAFSALKSVAASNDLPPLFELLNTISSTEEISAVQSAISAGVKGSGDAGKQSDLILKQIAASPAGKQSNYLAVLATIGGKKALSSVVTAFNSGDAATKKAAIGSLSTWIDASAANELLAIAKKTTDAEELNSALNGYVAAISKSAKTPVNKVIMLREAMSLAKTDDQKELILKELPKYKTFNAMLFAGEYLDNAAVQQAAAQAVMSIGLANKNFYGAKTRELLTKTSSVLKGQDSEYQKESIRKHLAEMPAGDGFVALFNGKDLTGWKGLVENPIARGKMSADTLAAKQKKADDAAKKDWYAKDGELVFSGHGDNLATVKQYGDFEMYVDWKIQKDGDAGIYLRGTPQVQIWDTSRVDVGAQVGSGGLYNNTKNQSKPTKLADNAIGDWNTFHITMIGDRVSVDLNGENVVDNVILENYWDRNLPIFAKEQIELQAHGNQINYRDIYVREITRPEPFQLSDVEKKEGFKVLFDGTNMFEWMGNTTDYFIENGELVVDPKRGGKGNLFTKDEYSDFDFRFEFQLTPGANNGLGIRTPLEGDAAYVGTEIQILDNDADIYKDLKEYQYHGSAYGIIPAKRGFLKPLGEWNYEEVRVQGSKIKVTLNGTVIVDGDLAEASKNGTADHREHPGLSRTKGYLGFLGHGSALKFKNIRVNDLTKSPQTITTSKKKSKKSK